MLDVFFFAFIVLPAMSDSAAMFCLHNYKGLIIDIVGNPNRKKKHIFGFVGIV